VTHKLNQIFLFSACATVMSLFTAGAVTVGACVNNDPLSDYLVSGYSCTIGDKTFSDFTYTSSASNAVQITASGITVDVLNGVTPLDPTGDIGLGFNASWVASGANSFTDSVIGFVVTVNSGPLLIEDTGVAQLSGIYGDANASVVETACGPAPCAPGPIGVITFDAPDPVGALRTNDATFTAVPSVEVTKDITVQSDAPNGYAHMSFVADTFSQTEVPEPRAISLLLTLGLVAGFAFRKKFQGARS
jgi:hypothetical protein